MKRVVLPLVPSSFMRHLISMLTPDSTSEWHQNKWAGKAIFLNSWPFTHFNPWTKTLQEEGQAAIKSNQKEIKGQGPMASLEQSPSLQAKWPRTSGAEMLEGISEDIGLLSWARTTNAITFHQLRILGRLTAVFSSGCRNPTPTYNLLSNQSQ